MSAWHGFVGRVEFEPAPHRYVDHSIFFTPPPQPSATTGQPMQLYCYVKQLDDVRAFFRRLDISKYVFPLRDVAEMERLTLHGQLFVELFPDHPETVPADMLDMAYSAGMHHLCLNIR